VKFGQSFVTFGSEWGKIRVKAIYRGTNRVTFGQKRVTILPSIGLEIFFPL